MLRPDIYSWSSNKRKIGEYNEVNNFERMNLPDAHLSIDPSQRGTAATHSTSTFEFNGNFATPTHVRAGGFLVPKNCIVY